ncbi:MAG: carbamoyl phosphate synthase small subunit [Bacillota bacterium]
MNECRLVLEDGTIWAGSSCGAEGTAVGEVVFNTGMTGYQEVLTDPSYCDQIVTMTYPLIGNYGVQPSCFESSQPWLKGFIVSTMCFEPSHWASAGTLPEYLKTHGVVGLWGVDTRQLTRHLRERGTMRGVITTDSQKSVEDLLECARSFQMRRPVFKVASPGCFDIPGSGPRVAVLDCGVKGGILRELEARGAAVRVFPAGVSADQILDWRPDGLCLSNGPGDPRDCPEGIELVRQLVGKLPIFGICLGNQLAGLALGADVFKLKYGHRGVNHPVVDGDTGRVHITSQNHGYALVEHMVRQVGLEVWFKNLNDGTVEGVRSKKLKLMCVQFHPEGRPGPRDTGYLFDRFIQMMAEAGS